jgi:hypothetical protein
MKHLRKHVSGVREYILEVLIAIDQGINAILGGYADETISSRCGKRIKDKNCRICFCLCWLLDKVDPRHCEDAIEADETHRDARKK